MAILLNGNDSNRLVELLAGSTALLANPGGDQAPLLPLTTQAADDQPAIDVSAQAAAHATVDASPLNLPVADSLDHAPITGAPDLAGLDHILDFGAHDPVTSTGLDAAVQPVTDGAATAVHSSVSDLAAPVSTMATSDLLDAAPQHVTETMGSITPVADHATSGLLGDLLSGPGSLLGGGLGDLVAHVGSGLVNTVDAAVDVVGSVLNGLGLHSVSDLLSSLTSTLHELPLLGGNDNGATGSHGILDIPSLGGAGTDSLTGSLLGSDGLVDHLLGGLLHNDVASDNHVAAPVTAPADVHAHDVATTPVTGDHGILDLHGVHIV